MLFHSVTEEDVERRNCLAKSCPYSYYVQNSLLEDQNHSIVFLKKVDLKWSLNKVLLHPNNVWTNS